MSQRCDDVYKKELMSKESLVGEAQTSKPQKGTFQLSVISTRKRRRKSQLLQDTFLPYKHKHLLCRLVTNLILFICSFPLFGLRYNEQDFCFFVHSFFRSGKTNYAD